MQRPAVVGVLILLPIALAVMVGAGAEPPGWAYNVVAPAATPGPGASVPPAAQPDETVRHLPGSSGAFVRSQIADRFGPADWYPSDHPVMPDVVRHGRRPDVWACSLCHYPNGKGRPENAGIAGLPLTYFLQTMADFRTGKRQSADPGKGNTTVMIRIATAMTAKEVNDAAAYFTSMPWTPWIQVVEAATVPKTRVQGGMFLTLDGGATEPIGNRIVETPVDAERTEPLRDPRSGFIAYVPIGSLKRGETLVRTGGSGTTTACAVCHGAELRGLGPVPGLAGRSPSYTARQLYDMQQKSRNAEWTALMAPVVEKLTNDDILAIAAYTSSLTP